MCTGTCTRVCVWVAGVLSTLSYIDANDGKHSREIRVLQVCSAFLATARRSFGCFVSGATPTFSFPFSWAVYASVYHLRARLASGRERRVLRKGRGACAFNNCELNY